MRRPAVTRSTFPSSETVSHASPRRSQAISRHCRLSSATSSVIPSRSYGRSKNSRALATRCSDPVTHRCSSGPSDATVSANAWLQEGCTSTSTPSGTQTRSSSTSRARGCAEEVSTILLASGCSAPSKPAASCPLPTPTTNVHSDAIPRRSSASASPPGRLCAPSNSTSGSRRARSNRPGHWCSSTTFAACSAASSSPSRNSPTASASRAFST